MRHSDTDNIMNKGPVMSDKGETFVCEEYESTFMGQPTKGLGILGYDNILQKY